MGKFTARQQLDNLADALVDSILDLTDEQIWEETVEEYGSEEAAKAEIVRIERMIEDAIRKPT